MHLIAHIHSHLLNEHVIFSRNVFSIELLLVIQVDFFWINREQRSFEWFVSLLSQLEIEQAEQGGAMERFLGEIEIKRLWVSHAKMR